MIMQPTWRPMSPEEAALIQAIVSAAGIQGGDALIKDLGGALVANAARWILDVKTSAIGEGIDLPDGPFPARAFVPNSAAYQGEIIVWLTRGHLSGLEYAWTTDEPPTAWPGLGGMEVVAY